MPTRLGMRLPETIYFFPWQIINMGCVCYGKSAQRLILPLETCQLADEHGWTRKGKQTSTVLLYFDSEFYNTSS